MNFRLFFLFIVSIIVISCDSYKGNKCVNIQSCHDTISLNQEYLAYLYVPYNDSILPDFKIVIENDTFLVPFDEELKCGIFKTVGREYGKTVYKGFVRYLNKENQFEKENYEITFYVEK